MRFSKAPRYKTERQSFLSKFKAKFKLAYNSFLKSFRFIIASIIMVLTLLFILIYSGLKKILSVIFDELRTSTSKASNTISQGLTSTHRTLTSLLDKSSRSNLISSLAYWFIPHLPKLNNHFDFQYSIFLPLLVPLSIAVYLVLVNVNALTLTFAFVLLGFSVLYLVTVVETVLYKYLVFNLLGFGLALFACHLSLSSSVWYGFTVIAVFRPWWLSGFALYYLTDQGLLPLHIFVYILLTWFVSLLLDVITLFSRR